MPPDILAGRTERGTGEEADGEEGTTSQQSGVWLSLGATEEARRLESQSWLDTVWGSVLQELA